jgi:hypothetical protein
LIEKGKEKMTTKSNNLNWDIPNHRDKHWASLFTALIQEIDASIASHATTLLTKLDTWLNKGSATAENTDKGIAMHCVTETGSHLRCLSKDANKAITDPYEITIKVTLTAESDDSPALIFGWFCNPGGQP